jgi:hypothetical protein
MWVYMSSPVPLPLMVPMSCCSSCVMSMLGKSPTPEVQCRLLIAGCQENPGRDTWHRLVAQRCCVPILCLPLDVAASLFCPDETSRFRIEI